MVVQVRWFRVAQQDGELVAEHDDLEVLGSTGPCSEVGEADEEPVEEAEHVAESYANPQATDTADFGYPQILTGWCCLTLSACRSRRSCVRDDPTAWALVPLHAHVEPRVDRREWSVLRQQRRGDSETGDRSGAAWHQAETKASGSTNRTRWVVADYVPFYFAARSPMLGSIYSGHVPGYTGGQDEVVYLLTEIDHITGAGRSFVFTDRNAALGVAEFDNDLGHLDGLVDWPLMQGKMWSNSTSEPDRMERRMAEFLVHRHVPWSAIVGIAAIDENRASQAAAVLATVGDTTPVRVRKGWYF